MNGYPIFQLSASGTLPTELLSLSIFIFLLHISPIVSYCIIRYNRIMCKSNSSKPLIEVLSPEGWTSAEVDTCMVRVIQKLNSLGIATCFCCCGHEDNMMVGPYITLKYNPKYSPKDIVNLILKYKPKWKSRYVTCYLRAPEKHFPYKSCTIRAQSKFINWGTEPTYLAKPTRKMSQIDRKRIAKEIKRNQKPKVKT